jgi:leader peptidase (prepilin peptidase)/N-methyltransferase
MGPGVGRLLSVLAGLLLDVVATAFLIPLVVADVRTRRLPDVLTLTSTATVLVLLAVSGASSGDLGAFSRGVAGGLAMAGVLLVLHLARPSGMGFGDVKLGLLLGSVVGARGSGSCSARWRSPASPAPSPVWR